MSGSWPQGMETGYIVYGAFVELKVSNQFSFAAGSLQSACNNADLSTVNHVAAVVISFFGGGFVV